MTDLILIEILAVPAERRRGRHNPRVVKRKMSNFPTRRRCPTPARSVRCDGHVVIVAPPEPTAPTTAGRQRAVLPASQTQPAPSSGKTFWRAHVRAWRASGLPRAAYCQQQNLSPRAFNAAVVRLRQTFRHTPKTASGSP
jgi:hypothetical protein